MKIPCENCICLPVCINDVSVEYNVEYSHHIDFGYTQLHNKCYLIHNQIFEDVKKFYLQKMGLIS